MAYQSYQSYGIERVWVERLKKKAKDPVRKERLRELADGLTKEDMRNPDKIAELLHQGMRVLGEEPDAALSEQLVQFIAAQQIDPRNKLHLIKLWNRFR